MILCLTSVYLSVSLRSDSSDVFIMYYQVYSLSIIRCTHDLYQLYSWSIIRCTHDQLSDVLIMYYQVYSWFIIRCTHDVLSGVLIMYYQVYSWCIIRCTHACSLPVCGPHALCSAALHRPVCACEDGYEGNPYDKCTKVTLAARRFSLSNISIRCRQELACDSDENDSGRYLYSNCRIINVN